MKRFGAISGLRTWLLPMNKLRLVAPTNVLDAASRVTTVLTTTALYTTDPLAQQVARKAAGGELANFTSVFRAEGRKGHKRGFCDVYERTQEVAGRFRRVAMSRKIRGLRVPLTHRQAPAGMGMVTEW